MKKFKKTLTQIFKPNKTKVIITSVILIIPLFEERVPTTDGVYTTFRYSPITLLIGYILLIGKQEFSPLFLILSLCAVVYGVVSIITYVITFKILKK